MPLLRAEPEDFVVDELPLYAPSGSGDHTWLQVEKRGRDTEEVASALAAAAGVDPGRVGWAGRKDRHAVARQWLSVPGLDPTVAGSLAGSGWRVLAAARHHERLRLGELAGNRFALRVREVAPEAAAAAAHRLAELGRHGLPNRFGSQRFGRAASRGGQAAEPGAGGDGAPLERPQSAGNLELGARLLRGERVPGGRRQQRLYLSALQAAVFNEALDRRPAPPHELLPGDLALVHASGALLPYVAGDAALEERAERFEVSPTGPIFGHKMRAPKGLAREIEQAAYARFGVPWGALPRLPGHLLPGGRRPLRVAVAEAASAFAGEALELRFTLPPGAYATVLVAELFPGEAIREGPATFAGAPRTHP
jgi:tRNA pseudouridine13 synthase